MDWNHLLDIAGKTVTVLATLIVGAWVWFKQLQGRVYRPRLRLRVMAERQAGNGLEYLSMQCELENVGLARVKLIHDGCIGKIYSSRLPRQIAGILEPRWEKLLSVDLLNGHDWVEPGGLITSQQIVVLPAMTDKFLQIWAHIESKKVAWNASLVVAPPAFNRSANQSVSV